MSSEGTLGGSTVFRREFLGHEAFLKTVGGRGKLSLPGATASRSAVRVSLGRLLSSRACLRFPEPVSMYLRTRRQVQVESDRVKPGGGARLVEVFGAKVHGGGTDGYQCIVCCRPSVDCALESGGKPF